MGIRLNKILGWGKLYTNEDFQAVSNYENPYDSALEKKLPKYKKFLEKKYPKGEKGEPVHDYSLELLTWDSDLADELYTSSLITILKDEGMGNSYETLVLITPFNRYKEWNRRDDDLDYSEEVYDSLTSNGALAEARKIKYLPYSPYPYEGWMHADTGKEIVREQLSTLRVLRDMQRIRPLTETFTPEKLKEFVARLDLETAEELTKIVPAVPSEVKDLVDWAKLFKNKNEIYDYRPIIATFWH